MTIMTIMVVYHVKIAINQMAPLFRRKKNQLWKSYLVSYTMTVSLTLQYNNCPYAILYASSCKNGVRRSLIIPCRHSPAVLPLIDICSRLFSTVSDILGGR